MTDEEAAKIGAILLRGKWQVHSHSGHTAMARQFIEELGDIGYAIVPKQLRPSKGEVPDR